MPITVDTPLGPFRAWATDDLTRAFQQGAWWDGHLQPYMDQTPADGWAIDLGANIGWFTVYLAQRFQHVLAVEAHPQTYHLLGENCYHLRNLTNVTTVNRAAYDHPTTLGLANTAVHTWPEGEVDSFADLDTVPHVGGFTFVEPPDQWHPRREWLVEALRVDDLVPPDALVRLVKVDVQGAGLRALLGLEGTIARCRPRLLVEFEAYQSQIRGDDWARYDQFFINHRYTVTRIESPWTEVVADPEEGLAGVRS